MDWRTVVPDDIPDEGVELLDSMLKLNDGMRIKASEALKHKFFDDVREEIEAMLSEEIKEKERFEADLLL